MDQVLAKLKRLRLNPYRKLLSDTTLYPALEIGTFSTVAYSPDHNLDEDSWFAIENFSSKEFFLKELGDGIDTKDYDNLSKDKFGDISCILALQNQDVYFQKVTPSSFLKRKLIQFGETVTLEQSANRIIVKSTPDAVFVTASDILLFRDLATVSSIFDGIDQLYKEATEVEVKAFLASDFIKVSEGYDHNAVSKPNRKRLALVINTLKNMPAGQRQGLVNYIKEYCVDKVSVTEDGEYFVISNDVQLKFVLYGIEERFYTTQHSQQKRLANSVATMD